MDEKTLQGHRIALEIEVATLLARFEVDTGKVIRRFNLTYDPVSDRTIVEVDYLTEEERGRKPMVQT